MYSLLSLWMEFEMGMVMSLKSLFVCISLERES